jgi:hypothetical protein
MPKASLHISRILLASLFLVFNVGLPILLDTCPMPKPVGSMMCPLCRGEAGGARGEVLKGKPCCAPVIAAERNTNEFLTVQKILCTPIAAPCTIVHPVAAIHPRVSPAFAPAPSQFAPDDIPVIYSSLLI